VMAEIFGRIDAQAALPRALSKVLTSRCAGQRRPPTRRVRGDFIGAVTHANCRRRWGPDAKRTPSAMVLAAPGPRRCSRSARGRGRRRS
jgi:hypothetical protein